MSGEAPDSAGIEMMSALSDCLPAERIGCVPAQEPPWPGAGSGLPEA
jgi:hypothetical protein